MTDNKSTKGKMQVNGAVGRGQALLLQYDVERV